MLYNISIGVRPRAPATPGDELKAVEHFPSDRNFSLFRGQTVDTLEARCSRESVASRMRVSTHQKEKTEARRQKRRREKIGKRREVELIPPWLGL